VLLLFVVEFVPYLVHDLGRVVLDLLALALKVSDQGVDHLLLRPVELEVRQRQFHVLVHEQDRDTVEAPTQFLDLQLLDLEVYVLLGVLDVDLILIGGQVHVGHPLVLQNGQLVDGGQGG